MSKEKTAISPRLLTPLLITSALGYGLLNVPYYAVKVMGANGYLAMPIAAVLALPGLAAIYLLALRFPGQTLIEQGESILGPVFGRIIGLCYLGFLIVFLAMLTRDMVNQVGAYFLDKTPLTVIILVYLLLTAFLASRGIETITRLASFIIIPAMIIITMLGVAAYQNVTWTRVLPMFTPNVWDYVKGGFLATNLFYLLGGSAFVLPYLKPARSFPRVIGWTILIIAPFYLLYAIGTIGVFGHKYLLNFAWTSLEFVHILEYPYFLLEQAGLLMIIDWTTLILLASGFFYYILALGTSQITGTLDYKRWVWLLLPLIVIIILLPQSNTQTKAITEILVQSGWMVFFAYPLVLWLIALIFKLRGSSADEK